MPKPRAGWGVALVFPADYQPTIPVAAIEN